MSSNETSPMRSNQDFEFLNIRAVQLDPVDLRDLPRISAVCFSFNVIARLADSFGF